MICFIQETVVTLQKGDYYTIMTGDTNSRHCALPAGGSRGFAPAGKRAKAFVEKALKGVEYIIVRSSKSDKYDRYLDIFYGKEEMFLNQELLDNNLAVGYKEK